MDSKGTGDEPDAVPDLQQSGPHPPPPPTTTTTAGQSLDSGVVADDDASVNVHLSQHSEEAYRMDRQRGKLLLICNTLFDRRLGLPERKGTAKDIDAINRVFGSILGFKVTELKELKAYEMLQQISAAATAPDNEHCDCFAVFILTHGTDGGKLYGTDDDILISQLMHPLKDSQYLVGKPKMLFVQSCRGKLKDRGKRVSAESDGPGSGQQVIIPAEADFLYVFSTADGYVSFQNPNTGSWFVQALCKELENNWQQLEMMTMLTRVCRCLSYSFASYAPSTPSIHKLKQVSSVTTTLTKAIRFFQP